MNIILVRIGILLAATACLLAAPSAPLMMYPAIILAATYAVLRYHTRDME